MEGTNTVKGTNAMEGANAVRNGAEWIDRLAAAARQQEALHQGLDSRVTTAAGKRTTGELSLYDFCDSLEMEELERFLTLYNAEAGPEDASDADKKSSTIGELLGVAMRMSLSDFCALSPSDFRAANKALLKKEVKRGRPRKNTVSE